jgi:SP family myo-inositol transporter-like MFS transporter 13
MAVLVGEQSWSWLPCLGLWLSILLALAVCPSKPTSFFPVEVRALGTMMINISNWGPNIVVSSTFLSMMKGISPSGTFGFNAVLRFLGLDLCDLLLP